MDRNIELEDRVYKLEGQGHERQKALIQLGALVYHLLSRNVELVGKLQEAYHKVESLRAKKEAIRIHLE